MYFGENSIAEVAELFTTIKENNTNTNLSSSIKLNADTDRETYLENINTIQNLIQQGIFYEINYCVNFHNTFSNFNPYSTYLKLVKNTDAPFSSFFREKENYILSASPERFLRKKGSVLTSQPIKGTAKRGDNAEEDSIILNALQTDEKEISENVMIVDLVRNDLSKIAKKNSVNVDELCEPYTFKTVHQLISTVSCQLKKQISFSDIIQALFPMGSMTGAPKISSILNIHSLESFNRGIYSGSIGYLEPNGNFDFNVVIRTLIANMETKQISCSVGGAITIKSQPINEYEECILKLKAIEKTLC